MEDSGQIIEFEIVKDKKGRLVLHTVREYIPEEKEYGIYYEPFFVTGKFKEFLKRELIDRGADMRPDRHETIYLECDTKDLIWD